MRTHTAFIATGTFLVLAVLAACSSSTDSTATPACAAGDHPACKCANGTASVASCVDGKVSACACGSDAGASDGGMTGNHEGGVSTSDAGFGQYLGPCNDTPDCPMGNICFTFGTKGKVCTKMCTDSTMCPAPSPKCNPKMVCAPPD